MSSLEIMLYVGMATTVVSALWHLAVLVSLVMIAIRLWRQ